MEIRKTVDLRKLMIVLYSMFFVVYLIFGLTPAEATQYETAKKLAIPAIGLQSDVTDLKLENYALKTPDTIVGSFAGAENNTLLIGHSSGIFENLNLLKVDDEIIYDEKLYVVKEIGILEKKDVDMSEILSSREVDTIAIMTCAGEDYGNGDASHRLIVKASLK